MLTNCKLLLASVAENKRAAPAPSGPSLLQQMVKTFGSSGFIPYLRPLVLSKLLQPTEDVISLQKCLHEKSTSIFYTNYNGNVDLGVTKALTIELAGLGDFGRQKLTTLGPLQHWTAWAVWSGHG